MSSPCIIQPNPDISGIGIRVGVYIVSYLNAFIPSGDGHYGIDRLQASLLQGAKLNGFALIITAVVQTAKNQLDLFHAIMIIHQLTFLSLSVMSGQYKTTRLTSYWIAWAATSLYCGWGLYVWITAPTFGENPFTGCNHTVIYVFFFANVRATSRWLRCLFILAGSGFAGDLVTALILLVTYSFYRLTTRTPDGRPAAAEPAARRHTPHNAIETPPSAPSTTQTLTRNGGTGGQDTNTSPPGDVQSGDNVLERPTPSHHHPISAVIGVTFGVINLELTLRRNNIAPGENVWGFGQIMGLVIAAGGINEVVHFLVDEGWKQKTAEDALDDQRKQVPIHSYPEVVQWMWLQACGESERPARNELADQEDGVAAPISENEGETRNDVSHAVPAHSTAPGDEKV